MHCVYEAKCMRATLLDWHDGALGQLPFAGCRHAASTCDISFTFGVIVVRACLGRGTTLAFESAPTEPLALGVLADNRPFAAGLPRCARSSSKSAGVWGAPCLLLRWSPWRAARQSVFRALHARDDADDLHTASTDVREVRNGHDITLVWANSLRQCLNPITSVSFGFPICIWMDGASPARRARRCWVTSCGGST